MQGAHEQRSEVARLLSQISEEYQLGQNALTAFAAGTARHAFITAKMNNMGQCHRELQGLVGENEAMAMIAHQLDQLK